MKQGGLLIAGGGTGGHIYPAIAIAQAAKKENPDLAIDFVGTRKGLEAKIVVRENFPLHFVDVGALNSVGMMTKLLTLFSLPVAVLQGIKLILKLKPSAVIGVGGYASGPVMIAAVLLSPFLKMKRALFEPNAYPGLTNRWLAKWVTQSFTNFEASQKFFKNAQAVGIPIRDGLKVVGRKHHDTLRVLIFGGSQGAHGINVTVLEAMKKDGWRYGIEIVHQIGTRDFKEMAKEYERVNSSGVQWFEFLYDMPDRYAWADLVICRAGASTLAELAACQKASVLVPFPFAADNHQQENAQTLVEKNAAQMVLQKDFTAEKMIEIILDFKRNSEKLTVLEKEIFKFYKPSSAEKIAHALAVPNPAANKGATL